VDVQDAERRPTRDQSNCVLTESLGCGFYFHPSDEDLSPGTPEEERAARKPALRYIHPVFAVGGPRCSEPPAAGKATCHVLAAQSEVIRQENVGTFTASGAAHGQFEKH